MSVVGKAVKAVTKPIEKLFGGGGGGGAPAPAPAPAAPEIAATRDVEERKQLLDRQAAAAGATRVQNDQDLLGAPKGPKRRAASRVLLGE